MERASAQGGIRILIAGHGNALKLSPLAKFGAVLMEAIVGLDPGVLGS